MLCIDKVIKICFPDEPSDCSFNRNICSDQDQEEEEEEEAEGEGEDEEEVCTRRRLRCYFCFSLETED